MPSDAAVMEGIERHRSQRKKLSRMKRLLLRHRADTAVAAAAAAVERAAASVAAAIAALESITSQLKAVPLSPQCRCRRKMWFGWLKSWAGELTIKCTKSRLTGEARRGVL